MRVPHSLIVPDSKPPVRLESEQLMAPLAESTEPEESGRGAASEGFLGESAPEEFLREVAATLTGFLKDEPMAQGPSTGEAPSEH